MIGTIIYGKFQLSSRNEQPDICYYMIKTYEFYFAHYSKNSVTQCAFYVNKIKSANTKTIRKLYVQKMSTHWKKNIHDKKHSW